MYSYIKFYASREIGIATGAIAQSRGKSGGVPLSLSHSLFSHCTNASEEQKRNRLYGYFHSYIWASMICPLLRYYADRHEEIFLSHQDQQNIIFIVFYETLIDNSFCVPRTANSHKPLKQQDQLLIFSYEKLFYYYSNVMILLLFFQGFHCLFFTWDVIIFLYK